MGVRPTRETHGGQAQSRSHGDRRERGGLPPRDGARAASGPAAGATRPFLTGSMQPAIRCAPGRASAVGGVDNGGGLHRVTTGSEKALREVSDSLLDDLELLAQLEERKRL